MERFLRRTVGAAALLGLTPVIAVSQAAAGTLLIDPSISNCTQVNCSSETVSGTVGEVVGVTTIENAILPWTAQIFAGQNRCLRLDVTSQTEDLVMNLVEPNGNNFFNDDRPFSLRPLIEVASTSNRGWNTVVIGRFAGALPGSNFTLRYGVYPSGNLNCANPTSPSALVARAARSKPEGDPFEMGTEDFDPDSAP